MSDLQMTPDEIAYWQRMSKIPHTVRIMPSVLVTMKRGTIMDDWDAALEIAMRHQKFEDFVKEFFEYKDTANPSQ